MFPFYWVWRFIPIKTLPRTLPVKKILSITIFVLLCHPLLFGQQYLFHSYRQSDGLSNLSPSFIRQDKQGFLWIGTENGLFRFSGTDFERFGPEKGIAESYITNLYIDPQGEVWVVTSENLYRWTGQRFEAMQCCRKNLPAQTTPSLASLDSGRMLLVKDTDLWLLESKDGRKSWSSEPFFSVRQKQLTPELKEIHSVYATPEGDVWLGCAKAICQYTHGQVRVWNAAKGVPAESWSTFLRSRSGSIWAQGDHDLLELPKNTVLFLDRSFSKNRRDTVYSRNPLAEDERGNILASAKDGILRWNGVQWQHIDEANGLKAGHITDLSFDQEGDLWLGTFGRGLIHWIGYRNWQHWTTQQGLPDDLIWTDYSDSQNQVYIGTGLGMAILNKANQHITQFRDSASGINGQVGAFVEDEQHNIWVGTFTGALIRIDKQQHKPSLVATLPFIYHLIRDATGRIWICTREELYVIDNPSKKTKPRRVDEAVKLAGNARHTATDACQTQSAGLWFLSDSGLLHYQNGQWSKPLVEGLPSQTHLYLLACSQHNSLWVSGENNELWHVRQQGDRMIASYLPLDSNLDHAELLSILEDRRGWLWIGTDLGVAVWNGTQWRLLNQESGLIWNDITQDGIREDDDGSIWIATSNGLTHILRPEEIFRPVHLRVLVTNIERDGHPLPNSGSFTLPWSRESIVFQVGAPSFLNASSLFFRYRLIGLGSEWETTTNSEIRYAALPPGNYTLEVKAANNTLDAVAETTAISFRVLPPWWQTNTFYVACCLLALTLIFLIFRWRTHRLVMQQHRLEILVQQRTAELEHSREELRRQATYDGLTGLLNRAAILEVLEKQMDRALRDRVSLAVILADLDHFKSINDNYGHLVGDQVLREVANRIKSNIRPYDFVGRYGGEELLLIFPCYYPSQNDPNFTARLESLHKCICSAPIQVASQNGETFDLAVTCSFGVSWVHSSGQTTQKRTQWVEQILHLSDTALYRAKHLGRNRIEFA